MQIWSNSFRNGERIPERCAFGKPDPKTHIALSENRNPHIAWSDLPAGTKSLVLICHDSDVPSRPDDVNKEGRTIPASLPRVDFYHWVLVDIPPTPASIAEGEFSSGVTPRGKKGPEAPRGTRQGLNDYTQWFSGDKDMEGEYFGYDGPCPPWNDELLHHYHFTLYATDLERCPVEGKFRAPDVLRAIEGHVLEKAEIVGTYSLNPAVR
ncbi:MAG: phosphatidylethanolamine-binding protein [Candidatus Binatia bacterium]|nr:MAG: phosphatidylethanolamine-binding protein [Candidatus Binatia bacterium]